MGSDGVACGLEAANGISDGCGFIFYALVAVFVVSILLSILEACFIKVKSGFATTNENPAVKQSDFAYTRNIIFQNEHCEVVMIDWKPGEKSALHDHGESSGFIRVLSGQIFQDVYDKETKKSRGRTFHNPGDVILETPDIIHQMGNTSKEAPAKTLHFYLPPLKMTDYTEEDLLVPCPVCRGAAKVLKEIPSANPPEWIDCWSCDGKGKRLNY